MRAMILGPAEIQRLSELRVYAETHPLSMDDMLDCMNNPELSPGNDPLFQCAIPFGFKIVFTTEQHEPGIVRHLSMSIDAPNKLPDVAAVIGIMKALGFRSELENCKIKIEDIGDGYQSINVGELIEL